MSPGLSPGLVVERDVRDALKLHVVWCNGFVLTAAFNPARLDSVLLIQPFASDSAATRWKQGVRIP